MMRVEMTPDCAERGEHNNRFRKSGNHMSMSVDHRYFDKFKGLLTSSTDAVFKLFLCTQTLIALIMCPTPGPFCSSRKCLCVGVWMLLTVEMHNVHEDMKPTVCVCVCVPILTLIPLEKLQHLLTYLRNLPLLQHNTPPSLTEIIR